MAAIPPNQQLTQIRDEEDLLLAGDYWSSTIKNGVSKGSLEGRKEGTKDSLGETMAFETPNIWPL